MRLHQILLSLFILILYAGGLKSFEKVVIWGHKLHSHTHSYIHKGFYDAFTYLGYNTYWFDNDDEVSSFDFSKTLFLTEGQVDQKIPLRGDGVYVLHNCDGGKYHHLNCVSLQVYTDNVLKQPNIVQIEPCIYFDMAGKELIFPWATNLFPKEIEKIKQSLPTLQKERAIYWIGTIGEGYFGNVTELEPFVRACRENEIPFIAPNSCATGISAEEHQCLITSAYLAPAIVGEWQKQVGYIPCRIFKNISYGQMGVTNSRHTYELFDRKIVYNPDTYQLFYDAQERLKTITQEEINALMDVVKEKHTYLNRAHTLLTFLELLEYLDED
jgi:hypothetical protein